MTLVLADVLAVLEERPYASAELAALFGLEPADAHRQLLAFGRAKHLKRAGGLELWVAPDYVGRVGRRPSVDRAALQEAIRQALTTGGVSSRALRRQLGHNKNLIAAQCHVLRDAGEIQQARRGRRVCWILTRDAATEVPHSPARILAALASGPLRAKAIAVAVGLAANTSVIYHLRELVRSGAVQKVSNGAHTRWALASWIPPAPATGIERSRVQNVRAGENGRKVYPKPVVDDALKALDEPPDDAVISDTTVLVGPRKIRDTNARGKRLRQRTPAIPADLPPSWWVTHPPEGFTATAERHAERMRNSKEHFQIKPRMLQ